MRTAGSCSAPSLAKRASDTISFKEIPMFTLLLLLPLLANADDLRSFTAGDMADLSGKIGTQLKKCKELKNGAAVETSFMNATSESIDKDSFTKAVEAQLLPGGKGVPGRKYDLELKLLSTEKQTGKSYEATYTLNARLKQADEVLCMKTAKILKKGSVGK
jgi:hypothetical protein